MVRRATSPVLIGRAAERASLDAAFRSACGDGPAMVLVAGEAGIGKTRLVTEFAHAVSGRRRCSPERASMSAFRTHRSPTPFAPL